MDSLNGCNGLRFMGAKTGEHEGIQGEEEIDNGMAGIGCLNWIDNTN